MPVTKSRTIEVPLNRVEGDLEVRVEIDDGRVVDAWSAGTMYRGFENLLVGRGAKDGLVITPRICGICGTAHLTAAAGALDAVGGAEIPPNGLRVRNLALMTEHLQSDVRHAFLMFTADFVHPAYADASFYEEAQRRYAPFRGETVIETIRETKNVLEIVALLGGQWPHSSYMVPGGVCTVPGRSEIRQGLYLLDRFQAWYERRVLGCTVERWRAVTSGAELDAWLDETSAHAASELGFFLGCAREAGLDRIGAGHANYLSFGALESPADSAVTGPDPASSLLVPAGFVRGGEAEPFAEEKVAEHVAHSWFEDYDGGRHPFAGVTRPYASGAEGKKYSWAKAPRYDGRPAEVGPLAERIVARHPLFRDLVARNGASALVRELARLTRPAELMGAMRRWFTELDPEARYYQPTPPLVEGRGFGLTEASRGALGHWVEIENEEIRRYQIITPTAWNGSPRDADGVRGPWEEALVGTPVANPEDPVELGHVVRSFDPCLVCAVHTVRGRESIGRRRV